MYSFLHELFADKKGGEVFTVFGFWHIICIALTLLTIMVALFLLRNKSSAAKKKTTIVFINIAFGLYILDFFLMPLAYNEIDIEKLPFHACTAMCVMCFLSYRIPFLEKFRTSFVKLGFISNLVYLIYPAGVMWHAVHPFSYRVIQTLLFHSVMTVFGFLTLTYGRDPLCKKQNMFDLIVLISMTLWAMLGNAVYNGNSQDYSHFFNWFFVVRDPFYILPESMAPFIMPIINVTLFYAIELFINFLIWFRNRLRKQTAAV